MLLAIGEELLVASLGTYIAGKSGGGAKEKNAWYTLFAHALNEVAILQ